MSQDNFTSARSVGSFLTKFTYNCSFVIICSVIIGNFQGWAETQSVLEKQEEEN